MGVTGSRLYFQSNTENKCTAYFTQFFVLKALSTRRCCLIYSRIFFVTKSVEASGSPLLKHESSCIPSSSRNAAANLQRQNY